MISSTIRAFTCLIILTAVLLLFGCRDTESEQQTALTAEMPLHLEDHLDTAHIEGSEVPEDLPEPMEWRFDEPQPDWKVIDPCKFDIDSKPAEVVRTEDALRIVLTKANAVTGPNRRRRRQGSVYVDLPDWQYGDWAYVVVRARASRGIGSLAIAFNLREGPAEPNDERRMYVAHGESVSPVGDGSIHTYLLRTDWLPWDQWKGGPWQQLGLVVRGPFNHPEEGKPDSPATLDILSVSVIPKAAVYADAAVGVRTELRGQAHRRSLYVHTPARLEYRVRLPEAARLDVGLGVLHEDIPVTFRIIARSASGTAETLFEETHADKLRWAQRSVDLSRLAGQTVTLTLEAIADRAGTIALWAAPTLSGSHRMQKPNVIFYIIDGAAADNMSVYGYNRRTTPNLERIAAEGAVFEDAYSNSSWSKTSTPSFMTSLHHSVLGGYWTETDPLPDQAVSMAQHLHRAGYQTAVFTTNPYCGIMSSLERGVDMLREADVELNSASSRELHEDFWAWRESYPAEPYWVHFQTTDVHWPWKPQPPMAGLFVTPERRRQYEEWVRLLGQRWPSPGIPPKRFEELGISRPDFFDVQRSLYDETMACQDYQIGRLVERLKSTGEWEHTLLIVAADHGMGSLSGVLDIGVPSPSPRRRVASRTYFSYHIPLIIVWPERIAPGQRFSEPVSMIDVLPTILDLTDLPTQEVMQGQSLAPLLLGKAGWEPRPVIIDEFYGDSDTGELSGDIAMIDRRWIAWGHIPMRSEDTPEGKKRPPITLYDRWKDPFTAGSVHEERPDLVEKYIRLIEAQWEAHQALAQHFTRSEDSPLTPEQLRTLRSLGYIQ
ncbi:MAG: sulfatase [Actinomycetota bacterium]|nr:sulfatase [Actinomycetota bacterium]